VSEETESPTDEHIQKVCQTVLERRGILYDAKHRFRQKEALKRWRAGRKRSPLLRVLRKNGRKPTMCVCGQHKPIAATHCYECDDARKIIRKKFKQYSPSFRNMQIELTRTELRQVKIPAPTKTSNWRTLELSFDDIVKIYENNND